MRRSKAVITERLMKALLWGSAGLTFAILLAIIGHVLSHGLGDINWAFLFENPQRMGKEGGVFSIFISTIYVVGVSVLIATPIGVGAGIFLSEYVKEGTGVRLIRFGTEALAGIPSIIFGLFGFAFFVIYLNMGWSIISGGLTLSFMILPTIVRTSEEAIKAVPVEYREGCLALGATKWQTIRRVVLPSAVSGILTGIILGIGRAVGETAAVILTAGSALGMPGSLWDPARTLSVHLYILAAEGISIEKAYATGAVLIVAVFLINQLATWLMNKLKPKTA